MTPTLFALIWAVCGISAATTLIVYCVRSRGVVTVEDAGAAVVVLILGPFAIVMGFAGLCVHYSDYPLWKRKDPPSSDS